MFKFNEIESLSYHNKEIKFYTPTKKTAGRVKKIFRKEPITITWMDNMKPGEIVIDIGANVGMYSLMSSVSRGTKVYAFEPEASNYNLLCHNIRLNNVADKVKFYKNVSENKHIVEHNYKMMQLYAPQMSVQSKIFVQDAVENFDFSYNKTEIIRMMREDGFGELNWEDLRTNLNRISRENRE